VMMSELIVKVEDPVVKGPRDGTGAPRVVRLSAASAKKVRSGAAERDFASRPKISGPWAGQGKIKRNQCYAAVASKKKGGGRSLTGLRRGSQGGVAGAGLTAISCKSETERKKKKEEKGVPILDESTDFGIKAEREGLALDAKGSFSSEGFPGRG